jgi:hypothetical protein
VFVTFEVVEFTAAFVSFAVFARTIEPSSFAA